MDAFYVSVELMRRPELRGRPVVVAGSGPRAVVTTASYEARRFGVGVGDAGRPRAAAVPGGGLRPTRLHRLPRGLAARLEVVRAQVEQVEQVGLDEGYLDLEGLSRRARRCAAWSPRSRRDRPDCSVGIGPNRLVAKVASDAEKPAGFVVLTREEACERFAGAPPRLLPGIGPKTAERLEAMGITTIARAGRDAAGDAGRALRRPPGPVPARPRALRGRLASLEPSAIAVSESRETTFPTDIADRAEQERCCAGSPSRLCEGLARHERRGRTIAIKVRLDDFTTVTRARTLAAPTNDAGRRRATSRCELLRRVRAAAAGAAARRARRGVRGGAPRRATASRR